MSISLRTTGALPSRGSGAPDLHPLLEVGDDLVRQLRSFGGIWRFVVLVPDRLDQQALLGVAGDDGRPAARRRARVPSRVSSSRPPLTFFASAEWHS